MSFVHGLCRRSALAKRLQHNKKRTFENSVSSTFCAQKTEKVKNNKKKNPRTVGLQAIRHRPTISVNR